MFIRSMRYAILVLLFTPIASFRPEGQDDVDDNAEGKPPFGNIGWVSHSARKFVQCFSDLLDVYDGEEQSRVWQNMTDGSMAGKVSVSHVAQWLRKFATECVITIYKDGHEEFTIWFRSIDFDFDYLNIIASSSSTGTHVSEIDRQTFRKVLVHTGFHALVLDVYQTLDSDHDKHILVTEFAKNSQSLIESGCTLSAIREVATRGAGAVFKNMDKEQDSFIDKTEFNTYVLDSEVSMKSTIGAELFDATDNGMDPFGNTAWASPTAQQFVQCFSDLMSVHSEQERARAWQDIKSSSSDSAVSVDSISRWIESRVTQCRVTGVKDGHEFSVWMKSIDFDFGYLQTSELTSSASKGNSSIDESKFHSILVQTGFHALVLDAYQTLDSNHDKHVSLSELKTNSATLVDSGCTLSAIAQVSSQGAEDVFRQVDEKRDSSIDKREFNCFATESEILKKSRMGAELSGSNACRKESKSGLDPLGNVRWASPAAQQFVKCFSNLVSDNTQEQRSQAWQEVTQHSTATTASVYSIATWIEAHVTRCVMTEVQGGQEIKLWIRSVDFDFKYLQSFAVKSNAGTNSSMIEESVFQNVLVHTGFHALVLDAYQVLDSNHDKGISLNEFEDNSAMLINSQCSLSAMRRVATQGARQVFLGIDKNGDDLLQKTEFDSYALNEEFRDDTLAPAFPSIVESSTHGAVMVVRIVEAEIAVPAWPWTHLMDGSLDM